MNPAARFAFAALIFATTFTNSSPAAIQDSAYPPRYASIKTVQAWIPMKDGVRLAVNLYMPDGPLPSAHLGEKFPAILEYLPYRKDDWTLARDWDLHSYFVRRGYVTARVDIRGTGASEGAPPDREYSDQEQQDGLEVIAWLAKQAWSNGNVGMMGISWGGFNSIQLARLHPPALKAIIAMCATEELFHDDIHYIDNLMHLDEYELGMDLQLGLTRAPDFPTDEKSLATRFDAKPWAFLYLEHQRDSEFWRRASVAPNHYDEYKVPSFMIGGFLDGYRDSIPRFFEHSKRAHQSIDRPLESHFPARSRAGPFDRMARRSSALVGLLAEGNAKRNHGRAALRSLHAPLVSARSEHRGNSRRVARGKNLAARQRANEDTFPRAELFFGRCVPDHCGRRRAPIAVCSVHRQRSRLLVGRSHCGSAADRRLQFGL